MSAPLHAILNDRDVSPIRNTRLSQPKSTTSSSQSTTSPPNLAVSSPPNPPASSPPTEPSTHHAAAHGPLSSVLASSPTASAIYKRRHASSSPDPDPLTNVLTPSSPFKRLRLQLAPSSQAATPTVPPTPAAPFNIFSAMLTRPELTLEFSKYLHVDELVSLYAMSQDFHMLANERFMALINGQALTKAPESARVFIFRCYASLCHYDPAGRENEGRGRAGTVRWVPTFKWLKMILFREMVVDEILALMAAEGHNFPDGMSLAVKKIWFTLDISDNFRRVGFMHNRHFWTDSDLYLATEFIIKLDMRLTHPVTGTGDTGLRKMLLGQRSLSTLWKVLRREEMKTQLDMLRMMVRWNYEPRRNWNEPIMGVPPGEIGALQWEGWGARGKHQKFMMIDQLVLREGIRRRLRLQECWLDMLLDGYVDKEKWVDFRADKEVEVEVLPEEEEESESESEDGGAENVDAAGWVDDRPEWLMSPFSLARHWGGDTESDPGPGTYPYPSTEEEDSDWEDAKDAEDADAPHDADAPNDADPPNDANTPNEPNDPNDADDEDAMDETA